MERNRTCHNRGQWEREENTYRVCRGNGQSWVFLQGKSVHLSRPVRQKVNISWYLEGVRSARWEDILQNKVPIPTEKETKYRGLFVTSNPQYIASTMAAGGAQSCASLYNQSQAPWADFQFTPALCLQPGLKGCSMSLSLGRKNASYFICHNKQVSATWYCYLLEINISVTEKYHPLSFATIILIIN